MTPGTPILDPEGRAGIVLGPSGCGWLDALVDFGTGPEAFAASSLRPDTADADRRPGDPLRLYEAGSRERGWPEGWR